MTWTFTSHDDGRTRLLVPSDGGRRPSRAGFVRALADDVRLRTALTSVLREAPFRTYFWETPPHSASTADLPAEMALVDAPSLASARPDPSSFADALAGATGPIATFPNLSGDAWMVVPVPRGPWAHLAAFVRSADDATADALWREVGAAALRWTSTRDRTLWISTSGLGVPWLHVRLDSRPKYYSHRPYTVASGPQPRHGGG